MDEQDLAEAYDRWEAVCALPANADPAEIALRAGASCADVPALVREIRRLRAANDKLHAEVPYLVTAGPDSGGFVVSVRPGHELVKAIAVELAKILDREGGPNYVQYDVKPAGQVDPYRLILVRPGGKSPHELRAEAEAERDQLRAEVERLRKEVGWQTGRSGPAVARQVARG